MSETLLKVSGLKVAYGGIQAVKGVDFEVRQGELVTLIGSNGAGKTTTMKAITGLLPMNDGNIEYLGKSIRGRGAWDLVIVDAGAILEGNGAAISHQADATLIVGDMDALKKPSLNKAVSLVRQNKAVGIVIAR